MNELLIHDTELMIIPKWQISGKTYKTKDRRQHERGWIFLSVLGHHEAIVVLHLVNS